MNKKIKRVSFSLRLQPYSGTLMAEVADWLNELERDEAKKMVEAALIMAYLPLARARAGTERAEIERCYWEAQDLLDKHGSNLRQTLRVSQPQWHPPVMPYQGFNIQPSPVPPTTEQVSSVEFVESEPVEEDKYQDSLFDDDEFD